MTPKTHAPVLPDAVGAALAPCLGAPGEAPRGVYVDATCGGGGHASVVFARSRPARALLLDRDPHALDRTRARLAASPAPCPVELVHARFSELSRILQERGLDLVSCVLADVGVSSFQLDTPERGFSFRADAPLDMRMDPTTGASAAEVLAGLDEDRLVHVLRAYGEEPHARRIARAIVAAPPRTTAQLAELVTRSVPARARHGRIHPATRTFQALRILVNEELGELDALLDQAPAALAPGGRLAILTFHSLEDRRVKLRFRDLASPPPLPRDLPVPEQDRPRPRFSIPRPYRGGQTPSAAEVARNPRARSARLRVLERLPS